MEQTISEVIDLQNKNLTTRRDAKPNYDLRKFSRETVAQVERFKMLYPTKQLLVMHFAPSQWGEAIQNAEQWAAEPSLSLKWVDRAYQTPRLAQNIVLTYLTQLYSASGSKDVFDVVLAEQQAAIFVGLYSGVPISFCHLYFGEYAARWKRSLSAFDYNDILKEFQTFLEHHRHRHYTPNAESEIRPDWPIIAYKRYIIREILAGVDVDTKETIKGVFDGQGVITREELMEIKSMPHDGLRTLLTELEAACPSNF